MFRRSGAILVMLGVVVSLVVGCESLRGKSPMETSLPSQYFGFRVTDGELQLWSGRPCPGATSVDLVFIEGQNDRTELRLSTPSYLERLTPGVEFERLTVGGPYAGFDVVKALPKGFDWRTADRLILNVGGTPIVRAGQIDFAPIADEITAHSAEHPSDTYYFPGLGWLDPAEVAAKDGKEFLTMCTPDPAKQESKEPVVGVRVTDDQLRFWTGAPCPFDSGVVLTFQPGQAELILTKTAAPRSDVEFLTLGGPYPEFTVTHPLPADFNWRTAKSVLLRVDSDGLLWSRTTNLTTPIAESAQHPEDTYYFQDIGWLNPADIADRDRRDFHTICARK
jgi:hypothetical protein